MKQTLALVVINMFVKFCLLYISEKADISQIQNISQSIARKAQSGKIDAFVDDDEVVFECLKKAIEGE